MLKQYKILFIHEVNYQSKVIFEMHEFPELLNLKGHDVTFLHFPEKYNFKTLVHFRELQIINGRVYKESRIKLITPLTLFGKSLSRFLATLTNIPTIYRTLKSNDYDVVILYSVPTTGWQTILLCKLLRVPVIFRALDVSHLIRETIFTHLIKNVEKFIYRNAQLLAPNNLILGEYCKSLSKKSVTMKILNAPVDINHFRRDLQKKDLSLTSRDPIHIVYMGSLFSFCGLEYVLRELSRIDHEGNHFKLTIAGSGDAFRSLLDLCTTLQLKNVEFLGTIDYQDLPELFSSADFLINPLLKLKVTNNALPHKVLQYLASGKPVISTKLDGLYSLLGDRNLVSWVEHPSEIIDLISNFRYQDFNPEKNIDFIQVHFSPEVTLSALEKTVYQVINDY
jgi:glycosyltransferase involved in cell wall biosynthesis